MESLQFDLATIKAAKSNFSWDNKLREGGFGEVYKGKLGNGQEVAVKRLSKNSVQGIIEFKTKVILVARLQHKNLVKIVGFYVASEEKILVYEFLSNSSLNRFLFDVFSFGVLVLEIVTGQKSTLFARPQFEEALLHRAWRLWSEDKLSDLMDPGLATKYEEEEATKCIRIALLCIQEDPARRPKMSIVVRALNGDSISLPMPKAPQILFNSTDPGDERLQAHTLYQQAKY